MKKRRGPMGTFTYQGITKSLAEWAKDRRCKVCRDTLNSRLYSQRWPDFGVSLTLPAQKGRIVYPTQPGRKTRRPLKGHHRPETGAIPGVMVGVDPCPRCLTMASLYSGGPHFRLCLDCILGRD